MKICIVSDSHDHREPLYKALKRASEMGAQIALHCGDLIAPSTLNAVLKIGMPLHIIHGNNTGDLFYMNKFAQDHSNIIHYHGQDKSLEIANRRIFMVHFPHYAKAMALTGDFDLVCNGHEHQAIIEHIKNIKGGTTLRIDPGSVAGVNSSKTFVFGDLITLDFEVHHIDD
jgi:putative phosphoesterase